MTMGERKLVVWRKGTFLLLGAVVLLGRMGELSSLLLLVDMRGIRVIRCMWSIAGIRVNGGMRGSSDTVFTAGSAAGVKVKGHTSLVVCARGSFGGVRVGVG